jgi:NADP-dependent 3-hydroxy acid dehydrogenase YdfG
MLTQGRGHVVNISSIYGNSGMTGAAIYGATKAAIGYFSDALRQEARGKIKVTVVKPTGVPATGLASTIVNASAGCGILGPNQTEFFAAYQQVKNGTASAESLNPDNIGYAFLEPEHVADAILGVIDQPWGVVISDITVRASGDYYIV